MLLAPPKIGMEAPMGIYPGMLLDKELNLTP